MAALNSLFHSAIAHPAPFTICTSCLPYARWFDICHSSDMTPEIRVIGRNVCEGRGRKKKAEKGETRGTGQKQWSDAERTGIRDKCCKKNMC